MTVVDLLNANAFFSITAFRGSVDYVAAPELINSVNAVALQKPLRIKGEPTRVIASALGKDLVVWSIKSATQAQDGLHVYDAVRRHASQLDGNAADAIVRCVRRSGKAEYLGFARLDSGLGLSGSDGGRIAGKLPFIGALLRKNEDLSVVRSR